MSRAIKKIPEGLNVMRVIDHFLYAGLYLPACSCFTDCPCSRDWSPYGTAFYWRYDCTADEVLLILWRNLLEEEHYTRAVNYMAFTRLALNSQSVFRCSNKAAGAGWGFCRCTGTLPSWVTPLVAFHILQKAQQREGCLLWCKTASANRNHNTLYILLCLLHAEVDAFW